MCRPVNSLCVRDAYMHTRFSLVCMCPCIFTLNTPQGTDTTVHPRSVRVIFPEPESFVTHTHVCTCVNTHSLKTHICTHTKKLAQESAVLSLSQTHSMLYSQPKNEVTAAGLAGLVNQQGLLVREKCSLDADAGLNGGMPALPTPAIYVSFPPSAEFSYADHILLLLDSESAYAARVTPMQTRRVIPLRAACACEVYAPRMLDDAL